MITDQSIRKLFAEYEKAFADLDIEKQAGFFSESFISAGPRGAIAQSKAEFLTLAGQAAEFYKKVGQTSVRILSSEDTAISYEYSMVKTHWAATFKKTGHRLIKFDVTYIVQKTGPEPKIIMFIAHQDEQKAMQEIGLV